MDAKAPKSTTPLHRAGLKATTPRCAILEMLESNSLRHLSAEEIYRLLSESNRDIGLATVYRVLAQFEAAGLVTRHHFGAGLAVFELKAAAHHDHVICLRCGRIDEFSDEAIEARQLAVATRLGFKLCDHSLTLYGDCAACRQQPTERTSRRDQDSHGNDSCRLQ